MANCFRISRNRDCSGNPFAFLSYKEKQKIATESPTQVMAKALARELPKLIFLEFF